LLRCVVGDLSALKQAKQLERLQLNDAPNISGSLQSLARLPMIQGIGLANTNVSGLFLIAVVVATSLSHR
jgi:hypothetical protein